MITRVVVIKSNRLVKLYIQDKSILKLTNQLNFDAGYDGDHTNDRPASDEEIITILQKLYPTDELIFMFD